MPRAMNDYTADKVTQPDPKTWEEPKKVAFTISSYSPGQAIDLKHQWQGKEVDTTSK